jgi:hypothetical protein
MMKVEYKIKQLLGVPMRFEELHGQKVAIYELRHKVALKKILGVMPIDEVTKHTVFIVPGRYIWRRDLSLI